MPLTVLTDTKAARGYALRRGLPGVGASPVRASDIPLDADVTTAEALAAIARGCLHQIAANAPGLVADGDPEWVHQMRVGTRRLRSCLSLVEPLGSATLLEPVIAEVKWLAAVLGSARDWDVFVTETLPPLVAWFARDPNAAPGIARLRGPRRDGDGARRATTRARRSRRPAFNTCCCPPGSPARRRDSERRLSARRDADAAADVPGERAATFAADLLARRHRKLLRLAADLMHASNEERHAARIAAKRLRYVAEFFAPLFPGKRTRTYLETLANVQDVLGRLNDAVTAASLAGELAGPGDHVSAGTVRGWVAAQAAAVEPMLAKAWRGFDAARPFWPSS